MGLSIKEAARILNVSESTVRNYIASGKLPAERKGRHVSVPETGVHVLLHTPAESQNLPPGAELESAEPLAPEALQPILERLLTLEEAMEEELDLLKENQRLIQELREKDQEVARKELELEKLRRDLLYQKRIYEKEQEDHQKVLQEKWALVEKEATDRIVREREHLDQSLAREREHFESRLALEEARFAERLAQEQENCARKIAEASQHEGFWT